MGVWGSKEGVLDCSAIKNDYELVIRVSKQLEMVLETQFGATGRGLHEKVTTARGIPPPLERQIRYLATIRNKLIHDAAFDTIDRAAFVNAYNQAAEELSKLSQPQSPGTSSCVIM